MLENVKFYSMKENKRVYLKKHILKYVIFKMSDSHYLKSKYVLYFLRVILKN